MKKLLMSLALIPLVGCGAAPVNAQQVVTVESEETTWVSGAPLSTQVLLGGDGDTYVGVWVDAPNVEGRTTRAPMAVSLIVDTSGSMAGAKIQNARMAAASLLESMRDGDIVSIYGFSNSITQYAPPTPVNAGTRPQLMARVQQLYPNGGTNLYGGLQQGVARMQQAPATHPLRRVFVISDGRANVGPSDPSSLGFLAASGTEWGAQVTSIGVGYDYDQSTLNAMAVRSSGRLYHLGAPQQMASILERELNLLSRSVALNAYLEVTPAPGVVIVEGATPGAVVNQGRLRFPLGSLYGGQHRELLFRARVHTQQPGNRPLANARLVYQRPGETATQQADAQIAYRVTRRVADVRRGHEPRVVAMVANHQANEAQLQAAQLLQQGQNQAAAQQLARAQQTLEAAADAAPAAPTSQALRSRASSVGAQSGRAARARNRQEMQLESYQANDEAMEAAGY